MICPKCHNHFEEFMELRRCPNCGYQFTETDALMRLMSDLIKLLKEALGEQ